MVYLVAQPKDVDFSTGKTYLGKIRDASKYFFWQILLPVMYFNFFYLQHEFDIGNFIGIEQIQSYVEQFQ